VIAAGSNNAFAINGFGGMPVTEIFSFFMMFIIFNFYAMLMTAALASFYVTSKPRHGRVRRAAIWHFIAALWVMLAFISTVWAAPAEKSFIQNAGTSVGLGDRAHNAFFGFGFALIAIVCMLIGFRQGARERREIREQAFAI
jgi:hypothetical protein